MGSSSSKTSSSSNSTQDVLRDPSTVAGQMLSAYNTYQPQFEQSAYNLYQQYLPQYAATQRSLNEQMNPYGSQIGETLSKQALDQSTNGLSDAEKNLYLEQYKSMVGDQVNAPIGANFVAGNLVSQNLAAKAQGQALGQSLMGYYQPTTASTVGYSPSTFNVGSIYNSSLYGQTGTQNSTSTTTTTPSALQNVMSVAGAAAGLMTGIGALGTVGGGIGSLSAMSKVAGINTANYR